MVAGVFCVFQAGSAANFADCDGWIVHRTITRPIDYVSGPQNIFNCCKRTCEFWKISLWPETIETITFAKRCLLETIVQQAGELTGRDGNEPRATNET